MRARSVLGVAGLVGYLAFLTHATAASRCPARELGACARVHAMLARRFVPEPATTAAVPMTARASAAVDALLARSAHAPARS
jgi:hypothetical protein